MKQSNFDATLIQEANDTAAAADLQTLNDLQLALVGGGIADGSFH